MAVKNSAFRENRVGSKVVSRWSLTWIHILAQKCPNKEFLKQLFSFQSITKTEAILLSIL